MLQQLGVETVAFKRDVAATAIAAAEITVGGGGLEDFLVNEILDGLAGVYAEIKVARDLHKAAELDVAVIEVGLQIFGQRGDELCRRVVVHDGLYGWSVS